MTQAREDRGQPPAAVIDDRSDEIDLLAMVRTLWRGKFIIAACMFLALVVAGYYAFGVAVPTYRATAQMSLEIRQESVVDVESVLSGMSSDRASMNTEMEVIRSRELVGMLVDELDLIADPEFNAALRPPEGFSLNTLRAWVRGFIPGQTPSAEPALPVSERTERDAVIDAVRNAIATSIGRDSYVFTIAVTTQNANKSAVMANTLARLYRDDQIRLKVDATEAAAVWLADRVSELEVELEASQTQINDLRTQEALISPEALAALDAQAVTVNADLQAAELSLARAEERVTALDAALAQGFAERAAAAADSQLLALATLAAGGDAQAVQRFDRRYDQLRQQEAGQRDRAREAVMVLRDRATTIAAQYEQQSASLIRIQQLQRESEATRVLYETFLTRLKETSVQVGVHQADSRILSEATPGEIVAPRKTRILMLALILGAIAGSGIVLLREFMQNSFRTADDLERQTGIAVVGQVPRIPAKTRPETIGYLADKPTSAAAEAIRNLRTSVLLSNVDRPPQVILLTSSIPGEGKTTLSIALAQNLAGLEKRVILIEGDIRRRTFTAYFPDAAKNAGLLSVISRRVPLTEAVFRHPTLKVDVLMGEKSSINAADVFSSESFRDLLAELRASYDYVIIDTPPVLVVPDARVIAPMADAVIYSVNWDRTTRTQVDEGLKQLRTVNVHVTGLVLSQIDPRGMKRYGYGNYYGAYSRYAKGYYDS